MNIEGIRMTFEEFAQILYSKEQNFTLETFYDDWLSIKLGDSRNGFTKEYSCDYGGLSNVYKEIVETLE